MISDHPDLLRTLARLNAALRDGFDLEAGPEAETLFKAGHYLIAYGSLVPGRSNHDQLVAVPGVWTAGWITGDLLPQGWGAPLGFPALRWRPDGPRVDASLLHSPHLPRHWARLDTFEGAAYRRTLVPFWTSRGITTVGFCYTASWDSHA